MSALFLLLASAHADIVPPHPPERGAVEDDLPPPGQDENLPLVALYPKTSLAVAGGAGLAGMGLLVVVGLRMRRVDGP
jgi:hypothetical protein